MCEGGVYGEIKLRAEAGVVLDVSYGTPVFNVLSCCTYGEVNPLLFIGGAGGGIGNG